MHNNIVFDDLVIVRCAVGYRSIGGTEMFKYRKYSLHCVLETGASSSWICTQTCADTSDTQIWDRYRCTHTLSDASFVLSAWSCGRIFLGRRLAPEGRRLYASCDHRKCSRLSHVVSRNLHIGREQKKEQNKKSWILLWQ